MTENNRIEYKQELTDDLEKEVVAFLNAQVGGILYMGINKTGKAVGVSDTDGLQLKIKDRLKNNILPSCMGLFDVIHETIENKNIIKVNVASGAEKPYYIKKKGMSEKGCYIRIGSAAEPMPITMIEELFSKRTRNSLGKIVSNQQDLSFEQLKIYYEAKKLKLGEKFAQNLEMLTKKGEYNYVAYLLADENGNSIKVAKYANTDRVDLIESNEYGYCSLVKATKSVLDKLELENKTITKITSKERIETRLWNAIALREAVINALIHNDYTREVPPKFEIFSNRLEITSYGGLFEGMTQNDFFDGLSLPRNKELMRIYKDLDMVEQLGSGVPRILQAYSKDCFKFSDNYLRMTLPRSVIENNKVSDEDSNQDKELVFNTIEEVIVFSTQLSNQVSDQVSDQVKNLVHNEFGAKALSILKYVTTPKSSIDIFNHLGISNHTKNKQKHLDPIINCHWVAYVNPDNPKDRNQKYTITKAGSIVLKLLRGNN